MRGRSRTLLLALSLLIASCAQSRPPAQVPTPLPEGAKLPVIFDDDGSLDGTAALLYLLRHPQVSVDSISMSYGEAHPQTYIQHIGRILEALGITTIPLGAVG